MFLNARAAKLLGLSSPALGTGRLITDLLHPEDGERAAARIRKLIEQGGLDERAEYRTVDERGKQTTMPDPYQFPPQLSDFDLYLLGEGPNPDDQ